MRFLGPSLLVLATIVVACDDSKAPKPPEPPPVTEVQLHAHFGRPGASIGLGASLIHSTRKAPEMLAQIFGVAEPLVGMADLLQPVDVLVLKVDGVEQRVTVLRPVPDAKGKLPEGYQAVEDGEAVLLRQGAETPCAVVKEHMVCAAGSPAFARLATAVRPYVDKWQQDHTDVVLDVTGAELRGSVLSAVAADLTVTRERLFERIVRGGTGAYGELLEPLKNLGIAGLGGLLTDVERVVVRVRLDPKGGRADARIDWAPGGDSAARRGTEALHGAATMASSLALLPDDVHVAVTDGAADPKTLGLATARLRKALRLHGGAEGAASLDALLEGMAPGYVGAEAWSEGEGVLIEIYRSRDAAVTKAAVAALSGEGLVAEPLPEGKAASLGELRVSVLALEHHLVFVSGGEKSVAYAKALPAREGGTPTAFAKGLGALPLGAAIDLPKLYRLDEPSSPLYLGYRVTEKGPDVLRSGASFQGEQNGLWMAARVILLGRDPEPAPTAADGSVP